MTVVHLPRLEAQPFLFAASGAASTPSTSSTFILEAVPRTEDVCTQPCIREVDRALPPKDDSPFLTFLSRVQPAQGAAELPPPHCSHPRVHRAAEQANAIQGSSCQDWVVA